MRHLPARKASCGRVAWGLRRRLSPCCAQSCAICPVSLKARRRPCLWRRSAGGSSHAPHWRSLARRHGTGRSQLRSRRHGCVSRHRCAVPTPRSPRWRTSARGTEPRLRCLFFSVGCGARGLWGAGSLCGEAVSSTTALAAEPPAAGRVPMLSGAPWPFRRRPWRLRCAKPRRVQRRSRKALSPGTAAARQRSRNRLALCGKGEPVCSGVDAHGILGHRTEQYVSSTQRDATHKRPTQRAHWGTGPPLSRRATKRATAGRTSNGTSVPGGAKGTGELPLGGRVRRARPRPPPRLHRVRIEARRPCGTPEERLAVGERDRPGEAQIQHSGHRASGSRQRVKTAARQRSDSKCMQRAATEQGLACAVGKTWRKTGSRGNGDSELPSRALTVRATVDLADSKQYTRAVQRNQQHEHRKTASRANPQGRSGTDRRGRDARESIGQ
ncbi:hypothetical protein ERJ75_001281100 [Trypanosoma vivax]|nr:hypothetical protein ERJ75_001281100 [Trypanosoma vivax]